MIPCHVCGQDIGGGWYIGFPPAPDSQKLGLCREHDLPQNREQVQKEWHDLIYKNIEASTKHSAIRLGAQLKLLTIYFTGGGSISLPCSSTSTVNNTTLKIITPSGENIFFPLAQVRNYALTPLHNVKLNEHGNNTLPPPSASK